MNPRESLKKLAEQSAKIEELLNECVELYKQQGIEKTREEILTMIKEKTNGWFEQEIGRNWRATEKL